jgi:hypothetical protein
VLNSRHGIKLRGKCHAVDVLKTCLLCSPNGSSLERTILAKYIVFVGRTQCGGGDSALLRTHLETHLSEVQFLERYFYSKKLIRRDNLVLLFKRKSILFDQNLDAQTREIPETMTVQALRPEIPE